MEPFEQISALIDDELTFEEKMSLFSQIKRDEALQEKWRNFNVIKTVLQRHANSNSRGGINAFVSPAMIHSSAEDRLSHQIKPTS
jgi:negative regulator of sigma E activity